MIDHDTHNTDSFQLTGIPAQAGAAPQGMSTAELAEILFCSSLQPSQSLDGATVQAAVSQSLRTHHGQVQECAEELAECYGEDPDVACTRMRWCRDLVARFFGNAPAFG
jgi:hypothetical protein